MTAMEIVGLAAAAALAGAMNAVAGGGTLVTFPSLLGFGTPPIVANATSTLALFLGTAGSVFGYRKRMAAVRPWLWRFVPTSIAGALLGSWLLTRTSEKTFSKLIPLLILFATVLFLAQGVLRRKTEPGAPPPALRAVWAAVAFQFAVAVYGGYFGAGIGILMLASLGLMGLSDINEMNALKTVLSSIINLVASIWFLSASLVDLPRAGIMTAGALIGYFAGAHYSQRIPQIWVRRMVTVIGFVIAGATFYKEFLK